MTNRELIKEFFKNKYEGKKLNGVPNLIRSRKEKDIEICRILVEETKYLPENCKLTERFYQVINNLYEVPKCEVCGVNNKHFVDFKTGYTENCSNKCVGKNLNRLEKRKATTLEKYGVEHAIQSDAIKEKMKDIFLEKYGEINPNRVESVKEKKKNVFIEKYGVDNPMKNEDIKNKVKDTCLEKYGSHYSLGNEEIREKSKQTCLEKYGVEISLSNKDIQEKIKNTMLEKYGVDNPNKIEEVREKIKNTCLEKYGVDHPVKNKEIQEKIRKTNYEKYDGIYGFNTPEAMENNIKATKETATIKLKEKLLYFKNVELINLIKDGHYLIKCNECNCEFDIFYHTIRLLQRYNINKVCPNCYPITYKNTSMPEKEIREFLETLNLNTTVLYNDRKAIKPLELDFYFPDLSLAIEYNGLYYHSTRFHDKNYHKNKFFKCLKQNIILIQIYEDEWLFKKDLIKEKLKDILEVKQNKINLSTTNISIKPISEKIKNAFLNKYNIYGPDNSIIYLGAFYNDKLISIMTFSSKYTKNSDYIELNRFCTNYNYNIQDLEHIFLEYFKINYTQYKNIIYLDDLRFNEGQKLIKLNFKVNSYLQPKRWYINNYLRLQESYLKENSNILYDTGRILFIK